MSFIVQICKVFVVFSGEVSWWTLFECLFYLNLLDIWCNCCFRVFCFRVILLSSFCDVILMTIQKFRTTGLAWFICVFYVERRLVLQLIPGVDLGWVGWLGLQSLGQHNRLRFIILKLIPLKKMGKLSHLNHFKAGWM